MKIIVCKRCNRKLKDPISRDRGYGPICFTKIDQVKNTDSEKFQHLEKEIENLKKQIFALTTTPRPQMPPVPSIANTSKNSINYIKIPIMDGGWNVGELQQNELFLKMKSLCPA